MISSIKKKKRLNPFDDISPFEFTTTLKKWIMSATLEAIIAEFITLNTHYK